MLRLLYSLWQGLTMRRAMGEASAGDRCTACEATDVVLLAPAAYRCNACGHEGGDGWAFYKEKERHASFAAMDPESRRESARRDLLEARRLLVSGIGDLTHARSLSDLDMVGLAGSYHSDIDGEGAEKHNALTGGVGLLLEARGRARDAQAKLGVALGVAATAEGGGAGVVAASLDLHADTVFTDHLVHRDIQRTLDQAKAMQEAVERVLADQFGVVDHDG